MQFRYSKACRLTVLILVLLHQLPVSAATRLIDADSGLGADSHCAGPMDAASNSVESDHLNHEDCLDSSCPSCASGCGTFAVSSLAMPGILAAQSQSSLHDRMQAAGFSVGLYRPPILS